MEWIATHAPVRGAIWQDWAADHRRDYCNPRSCARSDTVDMMLYNVCDIATHAPVRGAISTGLPWASRSRIATHAPVRGAIDPEFVAHAMTIIATHAPVRGAIDRLPRP